MPAFSVVVEGPPYRSVGAMMTILGQTTALFIAISLSRGSHSEMVRQNWTHAKMSLLRKLAITRPNHGLGNLQGFDLAAFQYAA